MGELKEEYQYKSEKRLDMLKNRTKRCVCKYCGGRLKLYRLIFSEYEDSRVEIFCRDCDRIEFGVEPAIYSSAKFFVENTDFNCFPDLDDNATTRQMTIAKVCEIMAWENQNLGFIDNHGFTVPLKMNENFIGECITFSEEDFDGDEEPEEIDKVGPLRDQDE